MTTAKQLKCMNCGHELHVLAGQQHCYTSCGLPNVMLFNIEIRDCPSCGEREVVLPRVEELHRVLAHALISKPAPLTPAEFRFLRKQLGWGSKDLAGKFAFDPSSVSRWETGAEPLSRWADRLIRLAVARFTPVDDYSAEDMDLIDASKGVAPMPLNFRRGATGWQDERRAESCA